MTFPSGATPLCTGGPGVLACPALSCPALFLVGTGRARPLSYSAWCNLTPTSHLFFPSLSTAVGVLGYTPLGVVFVAFTLWWGSEQGSTHSLVMMPSQAPHPFLNFSFCLCGVLLVPPSVASNGHLCPPEWLYNLRQMSVGLHGSCQVGGKAKQLDRHSCSSQPAWPLAICPP